MPGNTRCTNCDPPGSGKCPACYGTGYGLTGIEKCPACMGTGKCDLCDGTGRPKSYGALTVPEWMKRIFKTFRRAN